MLKIFKVKVMKKDIIVAVAAVFLVSSCGTYTGSGAYTGGTLGSILGSAIGGIAGGARGSDVGTIIGMAGGAVLGASIGAQKDKQDQEQVREHYERIQQNKARGYDPYAKQEKATETPVTDESGFDSSNSGDDILYDFNSNDYTGNYSAAEPSSKVPAESSVEDLASAYQYTPNIEITNARFVDDNEDGMLSSGEVGKIIFEVMNRGEQTLYDVQPSVLETTNNKHITISPSIHVESIEPGGGIRYTALVKADKRLKDGTSVFALTVLQGNRSISKVTEFTIPTRK